MGEQAGIRWLFERNVFEDGNPERMAKIVRGRGETCVQVAYKCVGGDTQELRPVPPVPFSEDGPVIVYGSMNLCRWLLGRRQWRRLAWYDCCASLYVCDLERIVAAMGRIAAGVGG